MYIAELWRYPVKSMAGEHLEVGELLADGIYGDRVVQVYDARGRVLTARTRPALLGLRATLRDDGVPLVNGRPWTAPEVAKAVRAAVGEDAHLVRNGEPTRFDVLPLLVATDGAIATLGIDGRRLRPNLVIAGVGGLAERDWPGRRLRVGDAIIAVAKVRRRCIMTTYDPDTQAQDLSVLRRINAELGGRMALDCAVLQGGKLTRGAPVTLL